MRTGPAVVLARSLGGTSSRNALRRDRIERVSPVLDSFGVVYTF